MLKKVNKIIKSVEKHTLSLGILSSSLIVFANVVARYVFKSSFTWAEESARYIIVWVAFIGMVAAARGDEHVKVDLLTSDLKGKKRIIQQIIVNAISVVFASYLSVVTIQYTAELFRLGVTSVAVPIPIWIIYLSAVLGFIASTLVYIESLINYIRLLRSGDYDKADTVLLDEEGG